MPPRRVLHPESLADSRTLLFYRSTIRPAAFGVLRLLPSLGYGSAIVAIFRPVGTGEKRSAADRAPLHGVLAEYVVVGFHVAPIQVLAILQIGPHARDGEILAVAVERSDAVIRSWNKPSAVIQNGLHGELVVLKQ